MVGILLSYWGGLFSEAMLVSGRVPCLKVTDKIILGYILEMARPDTVRFQDVQRNLEPTTLKMIDLGMIALFFQED